MQPLSAAKRAIREMLNETVPEWLRDTIDVERVKKWVREHLESYAEEKARRPTRRRPKGPLLPWSNTLIRDSWTHESFFVVMILREETVELFFGTGYWPDLRHFADGDAWDSPPADLYREWSLRFKVPCPPLTLGRETVKQWVGRDW
jgi:hypothetical protein